MTKEQEEVINSLEQLINIRKNKAGQIKYDNCICSTTDIETVLNMLKEKDAKLDKKDKMIDLMSKIIARKPGSRIEICHNMQCDKKVAKECKICTKQYFERKVEDENNKI